MRMDRRGTLTAKMVVNEYTKEQLKEIIQNYGEERWAKRIAEFIVEARVKKPIETTGELVDVIKAAIPSGARREGPHPAKRTFQALRIAVNDELGVLEKRLPMGLSFLSPGGRFCIISFHSLEDRIVKMLFIKANPCTCPKEFPYVYVEKATLVKLIERKPITPSKKELEENPRARSAKLRVVEKYD